MNATKIRKLMNGKVRLVNATDLDSDRVRFNWGYHDGSAEYVQPNHLRGHNWLETHFDSVYVNGWKAGDMDQANGCYEGNSEAAWIASGRTDGVTPYRY
jgi:hypothetical protein